MTDLKEVARQFIKAGLNPLPIEKGKKKPLMIMKKSA